MNKDDKWFSTAIGNDELAAKVLVEFRKRELQDKGKCEITAGRCNVTLSKDRGEIEVKADDGIVVLLGEVDSCETKEAIAKAARSVQDVLRIDNQVKVKA